MSFIIESEKNSGQYNIKFILWSTLIFLVAFMSQIFTYVIVGLTFSDDPVWETNIYNKCPSIVPGSGEIFNDKSVIMSGLLSLAYTGYLGIITQRKLYGKMNEQVFATSFFKGIMRLIVLGVVCVPFALPLLFSFEASIGVLIIIKGLLPCLLLGYVMFGFSFKIYQKLNLINEETTDSENEIVLLHKKSTI